MANSKNFSRQLTKQVPLRVIAVCGLATLLSGCGISSITSGLGSSVFGGSSSSSSSTVTGVNEEELLSAAKASANDNGQVPISTALNSVSAGCPKVVVRPSASFSTVYEEGRAGDSLAVRHRGEITKTARECSIQPGRVTIKYGFSGRVLLGPRGTAGNIVMPVSVAVDGGNKTVANDTVQVSAAIGVDRPIGYFSAVQTLTFDVAEGTRPGDYTVYLAFPQTQNQAQNAGVPTLNKKAGGYEFIGYSG